MRHIEESIQMQCVQWMQWQYPDIAMLLHHSPNGGKRSAREGARFKAMGTRAGFPDLALYIANSHYHALFIELKTDKGRQTDAQKQWQTLLTTQGYKYAVCRSFDQFVNILTNYLNDIS